MERELWEGPVVRGGLGQMAGKLGGNRGAAGSEREEGRIQCLASLPGQAQGLK